MDMWITGGSNIDVFSGEKDNINEESKYVVENTLSFPF
jgi:hypothetical protein